MYKIKVRNIETNKVWWEYGFTKFMMKRVCYLFNNTDYNNFSSYEIEAIIPVVFNIKTFKKCLINYAEYVEI